MSHGGKRPGAGRPKGGQNKRTSEMIETAKAKGMLPHEFLAAVARGESIDGESPTLVLRVEAAKAAAPFFAARLSTIDAKVDAKIEDRRSDEEIRAAILAKLGATGGDT